LEGIIRVTRAVEVAYKVLEPEVGSFVVGPPGIGKTSLVVQHAEREAEELGREFVDLARVRSEEGPKGVVEVMRRVRSNPRGYYIFVFVSFGTALPDDLIGVPKVLKLGDGASDVEIAAVKASLAVLSVPGVAGTLLLDDATNADDNIRKSFLAALFNPKRVVGGLDGRELSRYVRVIATGNLRSHTHMASEIPEIMAGRAVFFKTSPPSLEEWKGYMDSMSSRRGQPWDTAVYEFLRGRQDLFAQSPPKYVRKDVPAYPTPRAWEKVALISKRMPGAISYIDDPMERLTTELAVYAGLVGFEAAAQFTASKYRIDPAELERTVVWKATGRVQPKK